MALLVFTGLTLTAHVHAFVAILRYHLATFYSERALLGDSSELIQSLSGDLTRYWYTLYR
jgi:hypothetical protein